MPNRTTNFEKMTLLAILRDEPDGMTQLQLRRATGFHPNSITDAVSQLTSEGFVCRIRNDRVSLTPDYASRSA